MRKENKKNGYSFSRQWFDFVFENPQKITPVHAALWFWLIELNNRLNWIKEIGVPTDRAMTAIGTKSFNTYKKAMDDLIEWGFVRLVSKSTNQHTANVFQLVKFPKLDNVATSNFDEAKKSATSKFDTSQMKQTGLLHQNLTPHNDIDKPFKPFPNFFKSEKINSLFNDFIKNEEKLKRPVSEERIKSLIQNLNDVAETDYQKAASINQAIAGNYPAFQKVKDRKQGLDEMNYNAQNHIRE